MLIMIRQKRMAAKILKRGSNAIKIDPLKIADMDEVMTRSDVKKLINNGTIKAIRKQGVSRSRARKIALQKAKGRRKGIGSRKGTKKTREPKKLKWMKKIRALRAELKRMRSSNAIKINIYRNLYNKSSGGFFRSKRHLKLYLKEHELLSEKK